MTQIVKRRMPLLCLALLLTGGNGAHAAVDARFELDPALLAPPQRREVARPASRPAPAPPVSPPKPGKKSTARKKVRQTASPPAPAVRLVQPAPATVVPNSEALRLAWERLAAGAPAPVHTLSLQGELYNLTIDPARYPQFAALDGGVIILDPAGTMPPLVRTLIREQAPGMRVISAVPGDTRSLLAAMLRAAGFYSLEEQPLLEFGSDPRVIVRPDFKIERTAESVMNNDLVLLHTGVRSSPPALADFLQHQGVTLLEPFATEPTAERHLRHHVVQVGQLSPVQTADLLLESLATVPERNARLELLNPAESGIGLSVTAERYFERDGRRYVVTRFNGDPVSYTLFRLLEARGYRVILLEAQDRPRDVLTKVLSKMGLPAHYAPQRVVAAPDGRYAVELSGITLENMNGRGEALVFTDRPIEQGIRKLLESHGFWVRER